MPDDLQVPIASESHQAGRPSYRIDRAPRGLDPATKRLLTFAGAGFAALLVLGGAWTLATRRPSVVPVIEADSRPLRVKPENPGGMQVAGADEPDDAAPTLAPAPEAPAPLALRAQVQANRPAPPPPVAAPAPTPAQSSAAVDPAPSTAAPSIASTSTASTSAGGPQVVARTAAPAAAVGTVARPVPAGGGTQVQLAAVDSEEAARGEWGRLQRKMPDLLGGRQPSLQRAADKDGKAVWRVRIGGFADMADATGFCAKVRAKGAGCSLGTF